MTEYTELVSELVVVAMTRTAGWSGRIFLKER